MDPLEVLVDRRVRAAEEAGALRGLPGSGRPLPPDPLEGLPGDVRPASRLLRSAGYLPEEVSLLRRIASLGGLLHAVERAERVRLSTERSLLETRLEIVRARRRRG